MSPKGDPRGPQRVPLGLQFRVFFLQFLRKLPERSQTRSRRDLEPFWLHFGSTFGAMLAPFSEAHEKVKIELSPRRELNFQGPGPSQKAQKNTVFRDPFRDGFWGRPWTIFFSSWLHFGFLWAPFGGFCGFREGIKKRLKNGPRK